MYCRVLSLQIDIEIIAVNSPITYALEEADSSVFDSDLRSRDHMSQL